MNRIKLMAAALLFIGAAAIVSCKKQNTEPAENPHPVGSYPNDDVELLVNQIVSLDEGGNIIRTEGVQLNKDFPGQITILAENFEEAEKFFNSLIPSGADHFKNGDNHIWNLRDTLGVTKGTATLKKMSGAPDGRVAEIEIPVSARPLESVAFIPKDLVPLNDDFFDISNCDALDYYQLGSVVKVEKDKLPEGSFMEGNSFSRGTGDFVVLQTYEPGQRNGILVRLETTNHNYITNGSDSETHRKRASYEWDLRKIHNALVDRPSLHTNLKDAKMNDWQHHFMCKKNNGGDKDYRYHIKDDDGLQELCFFGSWYYYEAFMYSFHVEQKSDGEYGVEITFM